MAYRLKPHHALSIGGGLLLLIGVGINQSDSDRRSRVTANQQASGAQVSAVLEAEKLEAEAELANTRYQACFIATSPIQPKLMTADPVPENTAICDETGQTAVTDKNGRLTQFARTTDQDTILRALQ